MCNPKSVLHHWCHFRGTSSGAVSLWIILLFVANAAFSLAATNVDMNVIFFLDKHAVAQVIDMEHRLYQPEKEGEVTLNGSPTPGNLASCKVYYMPDDGRYQIWYGRGTAIRYAESTDGLAWQSVSGVGNVFTNTKRGIVTYDPYDPNPSRRYKLPYADAATKYAHIAYSADGKTGWIIDPGPSWYPTTDPDTQNHIFYSPYVKKWQIFTRAVAVDRRIAVVQTDDLENWDEPRVIIHPSPRDPVGMEFYGMPVYEYEDIFLGLLWKFQTGTTPEKRTAKRNDGVIESELTYSYDGVTWNRTYQTFIGREEIGTAFGARVYSEAILLNHEGGINIYSRGYSEEHGSASTTVEHAVALHKMRKDGFAGFESTGYEGYLKTKVFILKDANLKLNVNAPYGSVKVQLSDREGNPHPGYSFEDSIEWSGDDTAYSPQWTNKTDVSELVNEEVRFEFKIREGVLYSIRVPVNQAFTTPSPSGTNQPPAFSGPITGAVATEGSPYTNSIAGSASDPEGDPLTYSLGAPGTWTWLNVDSDGAIYGTPGLADVGTNTFEVTVSDSIASAVTGTLQIVVNAASTGPTTNVVAAWDFGAGATSAGWTPFTLGYSSNSTVGGITLTQTSTDATIRGNNPVSFTTNALPLLEATADEFDEGALNADIDFELSDLTPSQLYQIQFIGVLKDAGVGWDIGLTVGASTNEILMANGALNNETGTYLGFYSPYSTYTADASGTVTLDFRNVNAGKKALSGLIIATVSIAP